MPRKRRDASCSPFPPSPPAFGVSFPLPLPLHCFPIFFRCVFNLRHTFIISHFLSSRNIFLPPPLRSLADFQTYSHSNLIWLPLKKKKGGKKRLDWVRLLSRNNCFIIFHFYIFSSHFDDFLFYFFFFTPELLSCLNTILNFLLLHLN